MQEKLKNIFSRISVKIIPVTALLSIIQNTTNKDERIRIYLNEVKNATNKEEQIKIHLNVIANLIEPEEQFLLPSFEKSYECETDRFFYQKRYVDFNIKEGEKVLDIGSGPYPFPFATHLADLYDGETSHRAEPIVKDDRPFEVCSIEMLPYKDKEFDFVYCSHVLEHVSDPAKACEEIMRVGKRGYIETPTRTSDIMLNFTRLRDHHKWHINLAGNTLFFFEWSSRERRDTGVNDLFKMFLSKYKNPFQTLIRNQRDLFVNMFLWEDNFFYHVINKDGNLIATNRKSFNKKGIGEK